MNRFFKKTEPMLLHVIDKAFDGVNIWETYDIKGRKVSDSAGLSGEDMAELYYSAIFHVLPEYRMPHPGDRIEYNGTLYDVVLVEKKCGLEGKIISYRCVCGKR